MKLFCAHLGVITLLTLLSLGIGIGIVNDDLFDSFIMNSLLDIYAILFVCIIFISLFILLPPNNRFYKAYWLAYIPILLLRLLILPLVTEVIPINHVPLVTTIIILFGISILEMEYLRHHLTFPSYTRILTLVTVILYSILLIIWIPAITSTISLFSIPILISSTIPIMILGLNYNTPKKNPWIMIGALYTLTIFLLTINVYFIVLLIT